MVKIGIPLRYASLPDGRNIQYLEERLRRTIQKAGGIIIPIVANQDIFYSETKYREYNDLTEKEKKELDKYLEIVDGVLFPGGYKISKCDEYLRDKCIEKDIPTLGICLGMQLISSYKKDFYVEKNDSIINHCQEKYDILTHKVKIEKDSMLYKILQKDEIMVNSFHNYHAIENTNLKVSSKALDSIIESIEVPNKKFIMGIQWHPEISYDFDDNSRKIIDFFIEKCKK